MGDSRKCVLLAAVAIAICGPCVLAGCAAPPAAPVKHSPVPAPAPVQISPPGTKYVLNGWAGSGFTARLHLVRLRPGPSGESTVMAGVGIDPNGRSLKKSHTPLVGTDQPSLEVSAITATGSVPLGGSLPRLGEIRGSQYYSEMDFGHLFKVPAGTTSIRLTLHLGTSAQAAQEGTSVVVPLADVPVLDALPTNGKGYNPPF